MLAALLRLMTIFALAMMPFGMAAPAAAADSAPQAMEGHCPDMGSEDPAPSPTMDCAATCSALPAAFTAPFGGTALRPALPRDLSDSQSFDETIPEIATPPPRLG